jgi:hypothetical protein
MTPPRVIGALRYVAFSLLAKIPSGSYRSGIRIASPSKLPNIQGFGA